jgi:hydrogenase 3 maturation protease
MLVARKLGRLFLTSPSKAAAFEGCTAPENLTGEIIRFIRSGGPNAKGHLVLVDAADLKSKPGALRLVAPQELSGVSFSTHQLPLSVLVDYFRQSLTIEISIIAIQPRNTSFGAGVSPSVTKAVNHVVAAIRSAIPTPHRQRG